MLAFLMRVWRSRHYSCLALVAAMALDSAINKVDELISKLQVGLDAPPRLTVDPDDPWADSINPPEGVYKACALAAARRCSAALLRARAA